MSLNSIELKVLQSVKEVVGTYQNYEENFNDEKYSEIKEYFVQPLITRTDSLMTAFEEIGRSVTRLSNTGSLSER